MVFAIIAVGAILGFVFTSGVISQAQSFEMRKPITLGLQWLGLVSIALASVAGGMVTLVSVVALSAVGYFVWRDRSAVLVGTFLGSLVGALTGSSMSLLGANYAAFSNRSALILGVIAVGVGVLFAPHRQIIAPISALTGKVRAAAASMHTSGVKVSFAGAKARVEAVKAAARHKAAVTAAATPAAAPAAKPAKAVKVKPAKPAKVKDAASVSHPSSADDAILGRIRAIDAADVVTEVPAPAEAPATAATPTQSDEDIIAELERLFGA